MIDQDTIIDMMGVVISTKLMEELENKELSLDDGIVRQFIPCILAEGNIKFLMALARAEYEGEEYDTIMKFLLKINQARMIGIQELEGDD